MPAKKQDKAQEFRGYFRELDIFGQKVTLSTKGRMNYKTTCGASTTVIVIAAVLIYGLIILSSSDFLDKTTFEEALHFRPDFSDKSHSPLNKGEFLVAFGLNHQRLDPSFGKVTLKHITVTEGLDD